MNCSISNEICWYIITYYISQSIQPIITTIVSVAPLTLVTTYIASMKSQLVHTMIAQLAGIDSDTWKLVPIILLIFSISST